MYLNIRAITPVGEFVGSAHAEPTDYAECEQTRDTLQKNKLSYLVLFAQDAVGRYTEVYLCEEILNNSVLVYMIEDYYHGGE